MKKFLLLFFVAACANPKINEGKGDIFGSGNGDSSSLSEEEASELLDETDISKYGDEIDPDYCNDVLDELFDEEEEAQLRGATTYYLGTYVQVNNAWIGREKWILFVTPSWEAAEGYDCEITWDVQGSQSDISSCVTCDFALHVYAVINEAETNCPEDLWDTPDMRSWNESYEVALRDDQSIFYFQTSNNLIGEGEGDENTISFLGGPDCKWF